MKDELADQVAAACKELFGADHAVELTRPEEQFGDYATNIALQLAKQAGKPPREIAEALAVKLRETLADQVSDISVAGPGFINLKLSDQALINALQAQPAQSLAGQVTVVEYSDPNPFKILHVGHVYTTVVGDAISNLLEGAGAQVHRVNYGGDVGLHVGKTMWAILKRLGGEYPDKLTSIEAPERPAWMAAAYVEGNQAYDQNEQAKAEITALNKRVYQLHADQDHDSSFAHIYWTCRQWSYEAFDVFYERLGTKMERYYPESEVTDKGLELVKQQIGKVFAESDGAVVFNGENQSLHTRVFVNSQGLPTYEAKEVGLIVKKYDDYHHDRSIIVTANEQEQYMNVVLAAISQFMPDLAKMTAHLPHGMVRLSGNVKMSSRLGNIIPATEILDMTAAANRQLTGKDNHEAVLGAIKYAFLKARLGGNLIFDPAESVALEGNSGPYLQYAHARARSILRKAGSAEGSESEESASATGGRVASSGEADASVELQPDEHSLARKLTEYPEVVDLAVNELMPHHVCTYLYELAQTFNRFYEHNRVLGDERQAVRLRLVASYADTLKSGLALLGIAAPEQM